jgi:hypothetical protein
VVVAVVVELCVASSALAAVSRDALLFDVGWVFVVPVPFVFALAALDLAVPGAGCDTWSGRVLLCARLREA